MEGSFINQKTFICTLIDAEAYFDIALKNLIDAPHIRKRYSALKRAFGGLKVDKACS